MKFFLHVKTSVYVVLFLLCVQLLLFGKARAQPIQYDLSYLPPSESQHLWYHYSGRDTILNMAQRDESQSRFQLNVRRTPSGVPNELNMWLRFHNDIGKPGLKFFRKEYFQMKFDYFVVGFYRKKEIGFGPMIEMEVNEHVKFWAMAPITLKKDSQKMRFGVGLTIRF